MMHNAGQFLLGFIVGAGVVGSSVARTLYVGDQNVVGTVNSSLLNSVAYFMSINFLIQSNYWAYAGNVIGSTITVAIMAKRGKPK